MIRIGEGGYIWKYDEYINHWTTGEIVSMCNVTHLITLSDENGDLWNKLDELRWGKQLDCSIMYVQGYPQTVEELMRTRRTHLDERTEDGDEIISNRPHKRMRV
jgi:hypothetical protein